MPTESQPRHLHNAHGEQSGLKVPVVKDEQAAWAPIYFNEAAALLPCSRASMMA
jgi:hypothetical protein